MIRVVLGGIALSLVVGIVGCKCHETSCYDDCGLVLNDACNPVGNGCYGGGATWGEPGCSGPAKGSPSWKAPKRCSACGGVHEAPGGNAGCEGCDTTKPPSAPPAAPPASDNTSDPAPPVPSPEPNTAQATPLHFDPAPPEQPITVSPMSDIETPAPVPRDAGKPLHDTRKLNWVPRRL